MNLPDPDNGHTDIPHELTEALMRVNITPYEYRLIWVIWRKTYGWHKNVDAISLGQFEKLTGLDRRNIVRAIYRLEEKRMVKVERGQKINYYQFNLNYLTWKVEVSLENIAQKDTAVVYSPPLEEVHLDTPTKERKETIQKKEVLSKEIFDYYCQSIKKLKVWNKKRKQMICARLKIWTPAELKQAIDGMANSGWHMENGQNSFELIFRNDIKVEEYIGKNKNVLNDKEELP